MATKRIILSTKLMNTLAKGWRNIDAYSLYDDEGKREHANETIKALWRAGYTIIRRKKPLRFVRKRK